MYEIYNFLGGWAFQSTLTSDEDPQFLSLPLPCETEPRLLFAGEATHGQFLGNLLGARFVVVMILCTVCVVLFLLPSIDKVFPVH